MLDKSWDVSRKMYIERTIHLVFWNHFSDQKHNSTYSLMRFSLHLLTDYRVRKRLTRIYALPANTLIFASAFDLWSPSWPLTWPLTYPLTYDPDLETWLAILICNPDLHPWPSTLNWPLAWLISSDRRLLTFDPDLTSDLICYHWLTATDLCWPDLWLDL